MSDHETTLRKVAQIVDGFLALGGSIVNVPLTKADSAACLAGADALRDYRNVMANRDGMKSLNDELYAKAQEAEARASRLLDAYEAQQELTVQAEAEILRRGTCGTCKYDGRCGIQAVCVSSVHTDKRATGCTGAYEPKDAPTEPTR